jgi:hypothetical protein
MVLLDMLLSTQNMLCSRFVGVNRVSGGVEMICVGDSWKRSLRGVDKYAT